MHGAELVAEPLHRMLHASVFCQGKTLNSDELAGNLSQRLVAAGVKGRHLTLKIKRKKAGAPEPMKFLVSRSLTEQHICALQRHRILLSESTCFSCVLYCPERPEPFIVCVAPKQTGVHCAAKLSRLPLDADV